MVAAVQVVGAGLAGLGTYTLCKDARLGGDMMAVEAVFWPSIVLLIVGGFSALLGVLGLAAVCSERPCVSGVVSGHPAAPGLDKWGVQPSEILWERTFPALRRLVKNNKYKKIKINKK